QVPHGGAAVAGGEQQADLTRPPIEVEAEHQPNQQQRRCDEEGTEAEEQAPEVEAARPLLQTAFSHRVEDQAALFGTQMDKQVPAEVVRGLGKIGSLDRGETDRRGVAEPAAP